MPNIKKFEETTMLRSVLLAGVAVIAVAPVAAAQTASLGPVSQTAATAVLVQTTPPDASPPGVTAKPAETITDVVVTGSRITANGFRQPTPVTVVGEAEINRLEPVTIGDYLNKLPSFGDVTSATNPQIGVAGGGTEFVNLRNLGVTRTLVLLDGRRTVEAAATGGVDTVTLPNGLISRVEVVTGGASAAWGSDAVAGVVNFVLNHKYEGVGINLESGVSERGDNEFGNISITAGHTFLDGRLHVVGEFDFSDSPGGVDLSDRSFFHSRAVVANPNYTPTNGQPRQITVSGAAPSNISTGGVITSGPLRGIQFVGPNATPVAYNFGNQSGLVQYGGNVDNSVGEARAIDSELAYANAFTHIDYDLTPKITLYTELSYSQSEYQDNGYLYYFRQGNLPIASDNAFLPASIKQQLTALGQSSFNLGVDTTDAGPPASDNRRDVWRVTLGANGEFWKSWKWHAYYTHGENTARISTLNDTIVANFNQAVDAVVNPSNGAIVCRSTLTSPNNGCVPLNIFGNNTASAAALKYTHGVSWQLSDVQLDVVSADASGTLFTLPAGDVSLALGGDYINNKAYSTENALATNKGFAVQNFQPFSGQRDVEEGFVELNVPILRDLPFAKRLELNAAARETNYSTSGTVTTWKEGLSDQVTDDLRVRATLSHDIRAPTLNDLYSGGTITQQSVFDPLTQKNYAQYTDAEGNPNLKPEQANTVTAGIVYSPKFVSGLSLSLDYYKIKITGAIASVAAPTELVYCYSGQTQYCPFIHRDSTGAITSIITAPVNIASQLTQGWDFEADYRHRLGPGTLTVRALANFVPVFTQVDASGNVTKLAGQIGDLNPGEPKWKANLMATYDQGPYSFTLNTRYVGPAKLQNNWTSGVDVDSNNVQDYVTFDLVMVYKFTRRNIPYELTIGVDNLFDKDPIDVPVIPGTVQYAAPGLGGRFDLYDPIGRSYRVGLRAKF